MKSNARTTRVDVLFSQPEFEAFIRFCARFGYKRSTYLRDYANQQVQTNGMPAPPQTESRECRGIGRVANRASAGIRHMHRRAVCPNRATFGGAPIPRRV